jgi:hypothetical protein
MQSQSHNNYKTQAQKSEHKKIAQPQEKKTKPCFFFFQKNQTLSIFADLGT